MEGIIAGIDARRGELGDDVDRGQGALGQRERSGGGCIQVGHVGGAGGVDLEDVLDQRRIAVAEAGAVALEDEEFVIVDGDDLADAGASGQQIGVFLGRAGGDVDGDEAQQLGLAERAVLQQRALDRTDQRLAVGCDGEAFHAAIGVAAHGVDAALDQGAAGRAC